MARLRSAPSTQNAALATQTTASTRPALREKTNTARSKAPAYEDDGITEALVKETRRKKGRARKGAQNDDELVMTGALAQAQTERQTQLPTTHPTTTDELAKSDAPPPPPNAKPNRRPPRMTRRAVQNEARSEVSRDMKERMLATKGVPAQPSKGSANEAATLPAQSSAARKSDSTIHERSDFSLSSSPPPPGKLGAARDKRPSLTQQSSTTKAQVTPAVESSVLALKNFKRRPRQPSMLQMVQQRTASARPSAVNAQATEDPTVYDVEDDEEFAPEAEGTPLHVNKAKSLAAAAKQVSKSHPESPDVPLPVAGSKKRKSDEADLSSSALSTSKAKRRRATVPEHEEDPDTALLTSTQDCAAPPSVSIAALSRSKSGRASSSARQARSRPQVTSNVQDVDLEPSTGSLREEIFEAGRIDENPDTMASPAKTQRQRHVESVPLDGLENDDEQDIPNETMAEPASSSPLPSPRSTAKRTDAMADPLTHVSPPTRRERTQKTKAKTVTTAKLQSLLPKRRQPLKPRNRVSEYDIESDSAEDNDPELEDQVEQSTRSRRQTKTATSVGRSAAIASKGKSRLSKATHTHTSRKASMPAGRKSSAPPTAKKPGKTYARAKATTSDKENDDEAAFESLDENDDSALPDTSLSMYEAAQSKELEEARKKFAEVDDWDMEFESMSVDDERSSSQNWR